MTSRNNGNRYQFILKSGNISIVGYPGAMSHKEQLEFFRQAIGATVAPGGNPRILEIGSYDVNGSVRGLFAKSSAYIGVDLVDGPGVDVVVIPGELPRSLGQFDVILCSEVFEHDAEWKLTLQSAANRLAAGGVLITSCAATGRPEHGTPSTDPTQSPGTSGQDDWHYANLTRKEVEKQLINVGLTTLFVWFNRMSSDLYTISKKIEPELNDPQLFAAILKFSILKKMTLLKLLTRMPIVLALAFRLPARFVDTMANRWWGFLKFVSKSK